MVSGFSLIPAPAVAWIDDAGVLIRERVAYRMNFQLL